MSRVRTYAKLHYDLWAIGSYRADLERYGRLVDSSYEELREVVHRLLEADVWEPVLRLLRVFPPGTGQLSDLVSSWFPLPARFPRTDMDVLSVYVDDLRNWSPRWLAWLRWQLTGIAWSRELAACARTDVFEVDSRGRPRRLAERKVRQLPRVPWRLRERSVHLTVVHPDGLPRDLRELELNVRFEHSGTELDVGVDEVDLGSCLLHYWSEVPILDQTWQELERSSSLELTLRDPELDLIQTCQLPLGGVCLAPNSLR